MQNESAIIDCRINGIKMNFNLNSLTYGPILFQPVVPAPYAKLVVPGSKAYCAEGIFGNILFQEINAGRITIFYNIYTILEDLALDFTIAQPVLHTHIALKNENRYDINGTGAVYLKQGQFNMIRSSSMQGTVYLDRGHEYRTLDIFCPDELLKELISLFPFLKDFINGTNSSEPALLFKNHRWINSHIIDIIDRLLYCPVQDDLRPLYFHYKIKELLLLLLTREYPETIARNGLNKRTAESINEAKYIIETRFGEQLALRRIAKEIGINEVKLRSGFKLLFGTGMFDYLLKIRMQKAKIWLQDSDKPIKAIARLTGYSTKQSFFNAFKKYFHETPGSVRKN